MQQWNFVFVSVFVFAWVIKRFLRWRQKPSRRLVSECFRVNSALENRNWVVNWKRCWYSPLGCVCEQWLCNTMRHFGLCAWEKVPHVIYGDFPALCVSPPDSLFPPVPPWMHAQKYIFMIFSFLLQLLQRIKSRWKITNFPRRVFPMLTHFLVAFVFLMGFFRTVEIRK